MVAVIDALEQRGELARTRNPCNRCPHVLSLTAQGRRTLAVRRRAVAERERWLTAALTPAEHTRLEVLLSRMLPGTEPLLAGRPEYLVGRSTTGCAGSATRSWRSPGPPRPSSSGNWWSAGPYAEGRTPRPPPLRAGAYGAGARAPGGGGERRARAGDGDRRTARPRRRGRAALAPDPSAGSRRTQSVSEPPQQLPFSGLTRRPHRTRRRIVVRCSGIADGIRERRSRRVVHRFRPVRTDNSAAAQSAALRPAAPRHAQASPQSVRRRS